MNESDEKAYLKEEQHEITVRLLPVIVPVAILAAIGILGNILAFIFYAFKSTKSSSVIMIACLAIVDLIVCILCVPNIVEMAVNVIYTQTFMCQLTHFVGLWAVAVSVLILGIVAIDRHRKICHPFETQVTVKHTKFVITGFVIFGCVLSVRNFVNFDTEEVTLPWHGTNRTVIGRYCTTTDAANLRASVTAFTVIDFLLMVIIWVMLVSVYTHIIIKLIKLRKKRKRLQTDDKGYTNETYHHTSTLTAKTDMASDDNSEKISGTCTSTLSYSEEGTLDGITADFCVKSENCDEPHCVTNPGENCLSILHIDGSHQNGECITKTCFDSVDTNTSYTCSCENPDACANVRQVQFELPLTTEQPSSGQHEDNSPLSQDQASSRDILNSTVVSGDEQIVKKSEEVKKKKKKKGRRRRYNSSKCPVERNITFQMLTVSAFYILCFTPYFVVKILMRVMFNSGEEYELGVAIQIALRLPYMNSVANPIVYLIFNSKFRMFLKNVFKSFVQKCERKNDVSRNEILSNN